MTISAATICRARLGPAAGSSSAIKLFREGIDAFREAEIEVRQPTFAVSRKDQTHLVKANIDVGMMFFLFGDLGNAVHKIDRFRKLIELKSSFDVLLLQLPFRNLFQAVFQFV